MIRQRLDHAWRLFATGLSFALFGIGGAIIPWLAAPIIKATSANPDDSKRKARRLIRFVFNGFVHMMRALGILTWDVQGLEKLQAPGKIILANHPTLLDVVFLVAFTPHADCIVKGKLRSNPGTAGFIKLTGFIANDSGMEFIEQAQKSIEHGGSMIIFPEGTRTAPGKAMHFRRGAANLAVRAACDVTPVFINCTPITLTKAHRWYDIPDTKFHLQFTVGDDINIAEYQEEPLSRSARKLNKDLLHLFNKELKRYE